MYWNSFSFLSVSTFHLMDDLDHDDLFWFLLSVLFGLWLLTNSLLSLSRGTTFSSLVHCMYDSQNIKEGRHEGSVHVCTNIKIAMHGARRVTHAKNKQPMHGARQGKSVMHDARQTLVHDTRLGKISMHDARELTKAVHICTNLCMPPPPSWQIPS